MIILIGSILIPWSIIITFFKLYERYVNKKGYKFKKGYHRLRVFHNYSHLEIPFILSFVPVVNLAVIRAFSDIWGDDCMSFEGCFYDDLEDGQLEEIKEEEDTINKGFHLFKKKRETKKEEITQEELVKRLEKIVEATQEQCQNKSHFGRSSKLKQLKKDLIKLEKDINLLGYEKNESIEIELPKKEKVYQMEQK